MTRLIAALALTALSACVPHTPSSRQWDAPMYLLPLAPAALDGTWYEVMRFPAPFEEGCTHVTATYAAQPDGMLSVVNRCRRGGTVSQIAGVATPAGPGKLKVRLQGVPVAGDYWILGRSRDGRTVYVGTPSRIAGWVLHRDRHVTPQERDAARALFARNGYDAAALQRTEQR